MKSETQPETVLSLDPAKLFGFRNLTRVTDPESDIREAADLAFTKRGTEGTVFA